MTPVTMTYDGQNLRGIAEFLQTAEPNKFGTQNIEYVELQIQKAAREAFIEHFKHNKIQLYELTQMPLSLKGMRGVIITFLKVTKPGYLLDQFTCELRGDPELSESSPVHLDCALHAYLRQRSMKRI